MPSSKMCLFDWPATWTVLDPRCEVKKGLHTLTSSLPNLFILLTSRLEPNIVKHMGDLGFSEMSISEDCVLKDILIFTRAQIEATPGLQTLPPTTKEKIVTTFEEKADGMSVQPIPSIRFILLTDTGSVGRFVNLQSFNLSRFSLQGTSKWPYKSSPIPFMRRTSVCLRQSSTTIDR